jgi:hypothetical protein
MNGGSKCDVQIYFYNGFVDINLALYVGTPD